MAVFVNGVDEHGAVLSVVLHRAELAGDVQSHLVYKFFHSCSVLYAVVGVHHVGLRRRVGVIDLRQALQRGKAVGRLGGVGAVAQFKFRVKGPASNILYQTVIPRLRLLLE